MKFCWLSSKHPGTLQILLLLVIGLITACSSQKPKQFDAEISKAQLLVEPDTVTLGIARVAGTGIIFKGRGFQTGESYCVELFHESKNPSDTTGIPICCGVVKKGGIFSDEVKKLAKVGYILNADITTGEEGIVLVVNQPPIPAGSYKAIATGFNSGIQAESSITFTPASILDKIFDQIGEWKGKIDRKEPASKALIR